MTRGTSSSSRSGRTTASAMAAGACSAMSARSISCRIRSRSAWLASASRAWALAIVRAAWSAKPCSSAISRSLNGRAMEIPTDRTPVTVAATRMGTASPPTIPAAALRSRSSGLVSKRSSFWKSAVHIGCPSAAARPMRPTPSTTTARAPA